MLDDGRRRELLAAIGIDVYCLRASIDEAPPAGMAASSGTASVRVVIACPASARRDSRWARPLAHLVRSLGIEAAQAAWTDAGGDRPAGALPAVSCYLMLGNAAARACSAQLSLEQQKAATMAVAPEAAEAFGSAPARRALWATLKPLVRRLRSG